MEYLKLRELKEKLYFTCNEIAEVLGIKEDSAKISASRYVKKGLIVRLKRDLYILREKWENLSFEEFFSIANVLQVPSYISLMTCLYYYQVTTQIQRNFYESISLRRSKTYRIEQSQFSYCKLNRKFYFGFVKKDNFFIAEKEKALIDILYLYSLGKYKFDKYSIDFSKFDSKKIKMFLEIYPERTKNILTKLWKS